MVVIQGGSDMKYIDDIYTDAYLELLHNGMFRNQEGIPLSGSDADYKYDQAEYEDYAERMNVLLVEVHQPDS